MARLLRSFFYKLFRDSTFRIVAIVGVGVAVVMTFINCNAIKMFGSGAYCFISSVSPSQNYGIAIPINLSIFLTLLFSQGIIRNQIIVGNSKTKVYFSLLIGGAIFTLSLVILYVGICTGLGSILKGFYNESMVPSKLTGETIGKIVVITIVNYLLITTYTTFISTLFRSNGLVISLVLIPIVVLSLIAMIMILMNGVNSATGTKIVPQEVIDASRYLNPQHLIGSVSGLLSLLGDSSSQGIILNNTDFVIGIVNNIVYIVIFGAAGLYAFNKKDLK